MTKKKKSEYLSRLEKSIHSYNAKMTLEQEEKIIQAYIDSGERLVKKIARSKTGTISAKLYREYSYELLVKLKPLLEEYANKVSYNSLETQARGLMTVLGGSTSNPSINTALKQAVNVYAADAALGVIMGDIYKDNVGLSSRIWKATNHSGKTIQRVVNSALIDGRSAKELSKDLEEFVNPSARKLWTASKANSILGKGYTNKDLEYNALRLARTTISHSATSATKKWGQVNPYAKKVQWHSVHAQGRTCAECEELDMQIFTMDECPYDHPNGMCYQTVYYEKDLDEIADELKGWMDGEENPELDKWYENLNK